MPDETQLDHATTESDGVGPSPVIAEKDLYQSTLQYGAAPNTMHGPGLRIEVVCVDCLSRFLPTPPASCICIVVSPENVIRVTNEIDHRLEWRQHCLWYRKTHTASVPKVKSVTFIQALRVSFYRDVFCHVS